MFLQTQHVLWLYTQNNNLAVAFQIRILRPENSRKITIESSFLREEIENSYHRRQISTIQPAFLLLWPINVSHCRVHTGTLRTGHPVYSRATYIRNGGARDRVRSRRNVCARPCTCIYMRRGLVAARLPACLPACHGSRVRCPTGRWTQRDSTWGSSAGTSHAATRHRELPPIFPAIFHPPLSTGKRGPGPSSSPAPPMEEPSVPTCDPGWLLGPGGSPLWTRTAASHASRANIFAGEQHARHDTSYRCSRGPFCARRKRDREAGKSRARTFGRWPRERISPITRVR